MKAQQRGSVRRVAASAAVVLATLALTTPPPAQADPAGEATDTNTRVVRPPQLSGCPGHDA